jgi:hypothetical protein
MPKIVVLYAKVFSAEAVAVSVLNNKKRFRSL